MPARVVADAGGETPIELKELTEPLEPQSSFKSLNASAGEKASTSAPRLKKDEDKDKKDENKDEEELRGCCFSFGYGTEHKPCCLSASEVPNRTYCPEQHNESIGGATGFVRGDCPGSADQAALWVEALDIASKPKESSSGVDASKRGGKSSDGDSSKRKQLASDISSPLRRDDVVNTSDSDGEGGCCFSYGFGSEMEPCCLTAEVVAKRSACPERYGLYGGGTAFTSGSCPATASEAAALAGDAQDQLSAAAAKAAKAEQAAEEAAARAAAAAADAKSEYYKALADGATSTALNKNSKTWQDVSSAHSDAYLKAVGAAQADEALARVLSKVTGREMESKKADALKKEDDAKKKREAAAKKQAEAVEAEKAAQLALDEAVHGRKELQRFGKSNATE